MAGREVSHKAGVALGIGPVRGVPSLPATSGGGGVDRNTPSRSLRDAGVPGSWEGRGMCVTL